MFNRLSHFFLPQESNNFKARVLHHSSLSSIIGLILLSQLFLSTLLLVRPDVLGFASQISPERIVELTNQERAKTGAGPLKLNSLLNESAQRKAGDMFAFDYWAHNSPSGRDPWSFFKEVGYKYLFAGENLAKDFSSPEAVVSAWMASPTHRDNLLNPKYQEIGISVVDGTIGGSQTTLVVEHFGAVSSNPAQVASTNNNTSKVTTAPVRIVTIIPTVTPTPIPVVAANLESTLPPPKENLTIPAVLANAKGTEKKLINPFAFSKDLYLLVLIFLIGFVVLDGISAYRKGVLRLSGRNFAHFMFLGMAIVIVLLSGQGVIL